MLRLKKTILLFVVLAVLGGLLPATPVYALGAADIFAPLTYVWNKLKAFDDFMTEKKENLLFRAVSIAYKNSLRTFLSRLAYDTATRLAEGGIGKSPLFNYKKMGSFIEDVGQTTLADTLDILAKDNGFFNFDVCSPQDINLKFAFHYSLFGNFNGRGPRGAPRCTLSNIAKSWTEWGQKVGRSYNSQNFLNTLKDAFKPEQSDVGIYLTVESSLRNQTAINKLNEKLDRVANQGFLPVTEKISGFIKTPAKVSEEYATSLQTNASIAESTPTGDIVADSLGIFTNTLASKLMKQLLTKGLIDGKTVQTIGVYNWANKELARAGAAIQLASLAEVTYSSGFERIIDQLTQCPDEKNPGPLDCVMDSQLVGAIEQGLTVTEAIASGQLRGGALVGFKDGQTTLGWRDGLNYRSLVIMRIHRIIPATWELAALYNINKSQEATLKDIIDCYEDKDAPTDHRKPDTCRQDIDGDGDKDEDTDYNPYYHLIDPNWVLKAPESFCARKGFGYQITTSQDACSEDNVAGTFDPQSNNELVSGPACDPELVDNEDLMVSTVARADDYCADRKSCLAEDDKGACVGIGDGADNIRYGYCLKEQPIWRFQGDQCDNVYSSCENFTVAGNQVALLRDSLAPCLASEAGCQWYSQLQDKNISAGGQSLSWNFTDKIYLNEKAEDCPDNEAGCTNLSRMIQGVNLLFNGDFELNPVADEIEGWSPGQQEGCDATLERVSFNNTQTAKVGVEGGSACSLIASGYLPIDSRFNLALGGAVKADSVQNIVFRLRYFAENLQILSTYSSSTPGTTEWKFFKDFTPAAPAAAKFARFDVTGLGSVWYDNLQVVINQSPIIRQNNANYAFNSESYQTDYSQNASYAKVNLKVAPDYLTCEGYNQIVNNVANDTPTECLTNSHYWRADIDRCVVSGDSSCSGYAAYCSAEEIGCQGYRPLNNDPEVSARTSGGDVCAAECVGYESYLQSPTYFENIEEPVQDSVYANFIPETAQECSVSSAGCEEFTNLDAVNQGGEGKEYFTFLKQCVPPGNANMSVYYTWEGSDTSGYQLKKWDLLRSNSIPIGVAIETAPCTNITIGTDQCRDNEPGLPPASCEAADLENNPDCRDFFNASGEHFFRLQSRTVTASGECHPYRRSSTGQVYNADPLEGVSCQPQFNGCREYKGNRGNNIRNVFNYSFENGNKEGWKNNLNGDEGMILSNEAIQQGGHSLKIFTAGERSALLDLSGKITAGKQYALSFWAKKGDSDLERTLRPTDQQIGLQFSQNGLTAQWQLYELGPATAMADNYTFKLAFGNLGNRDAVYIDNVILKEYAENFYLIKSSWQTPAVCDAPYPGAQLGCQIYQDRQNQTHFLKSFDYLCSSSAIGCEAFLDTQNSTTYQQARTFGADDGNQADNVTVSNDEVIYLVNDPSKQCNVAFQGCSALGSPNLNRQISDLTLDDNDDGVPDYITGFNTVAKLNNPDRYSADSANPILCGESGLYCQSFNGELTGVKPYFTPYGAGGDTLCEWNDKAAQWVKKGTDTPCPAPAGNQTWGKVCPSEQSTCTQFVEQVKQADNINHADGQSYYYLNNDSLDKQTCTEENPEAGCIKFKDTALTAEPLLKVKRDRVCGEWLECQTGFETENPQGGSEFACLALVKYRLNDEGTKELVSGGAEADGIYDLADNNGSVDLENQSGYSHPGASWSGAITASGYTSPEAMKQTGQTIDVVNGNFETYNGDLTKPEGWLNAAITEDAPNENYGNGKCSAILDNKQAFSGRYSLRLNLTKLTGNDIDCPFSSNVGGSGDNSAIYTINPNNYYNLSFYAKSQNGEPQADVTLYWFRSNGTIINNARNGYPIRALVHVDPRLGGWQKYTLRVGRIGAADIENENEIPAAASGAKISIIRYTNNAEDAAGEIWFDDFKIEPALALNDSGVALSAKECRLYPTEDAPACSYQSIKQYDGWRGYCLEPDPFYQLNQQQPNNWDKCLQWYPLDSLQGDRLSVFNVADNIGYSDRAPLYYCAQTGGNYNKINNLDEAYQAGTQGYRYHSSLRSTGADQGVNPCGDITGNLNDNGVSVYPNIYYCIDAGNGDPSGHVKCLGREVDKNIYCDQYNYTDFDGCDADNLCSLQSNGSSVSGMGYDYEQLTLDEIGAIEFKILYDPENIWGSGMFFSDITGSNKLTQDWPEFDKVFQASRESDTGAYDIKLGYTYSRGGLRLAKALFSFYEASGDSSAVGGVIYYYLKDQCSVIAQAVSLEGGKVKEKTYLTRFNNQQGIVWREGDQDRTLGYGKQAGVAPYGSFIPPRASSPENWSTLNASNVKDAPLYVYNGGSFDFGPSAGLPWSVPFGSGSERICVSSADAGRIGQSCLTSANCGQDGVCGGIGKYCYDTTSGIMNGQACDVDSNCGDANRYECRLPDNLAVSEGGNGLHKAIERLQYLFVKIYNVWQWKPLEGVYKQINNDIQVNNVSTLDKSSYGNITEQPSVSALSLSPTTLPFPGGRVELSFTVDANDDQMPIEGVWINWGDSNTDYFRGPLNERPYNAYHIYTCANDAGCRYAAPQVNVKDHWGWCAGPENSQDAWVDTADCDSNAGIPATDRVTIEAKPEN